MKDEFYVGYLPQAPSQTGRFVARVVAVLLVGVVATAAVLVSSQAEFPAARFDFGSPREFTGTITTTPQPMLLIDRPGSTEQSSYYLVNPGKFGADVAGFDGRAVRLSGTPIYRQDQTMLELLPETIEDLGAGSTGAAIEDLGTWTLTGEIVDSKCFLGVMNPGNLKPHRACAIRCISGGIPPILLVRADEGSVRHLLLVGRDGEAINDQILGMIAEPLEVTGRLERHRDRLVFKADPATFHRIP
jgi:hypothetical protein